MTVTVERRGDGPALVRLDGPLDYPATEELEAALQALLGTGAWNVAIDLTSATPVDDAAVGVLYDALRRVRAVGGSVALAVCDGQLRQVLAAMGLDRVFRLASTPEQALRLLPEGGQGGAGQPSSALVDWPAEGR